MSQQAARRIDAPTEEASSLAQPQKSLHSSANIFALAKNSWPFWSSAQFGKADMPMMKTPDEIVELNRRALEAFSRSSAVLAEGVKEIGQCVLNFAHNSFAAHCSAGQEIGDAKSLQEIFAAQSKWAGHFFNATTAEAAKYTEMAARIASHAAEPIQKHVGSTLGDSSD